MEKFNLKWNDFQENVSKSFGFLRKEEDFFDVSLVCDDEEIVSAHKIVLSASSDLFKSILRKADHSKPMIFLNGVASKELNNILDYIYEGEVQLFQDELDDFLSVAEKLKIDGLVGVNNETVEKGENENAECYNPDTKESFEKWPAEKEKFKEGSVKEKVERGSNKTLSVIGETEGNMYDAAKRAVDQLVMKVEDGWVCKTCGKKTKGSSSQIRKHAEMHIEGLSFPCQLCEKTFRSRDILKHHKSKH